MYICTTRLRYRTSNALTTKRFSWANKKLFTSNKTQFSSAARNDLRYDLLGLKQTNGPSCSRRIEGEFFAQGARELFTIFKYWKLLITLRAS